MTFWGFRESLQYIACGESVYWVDKTKDVEKVTCKSCLKSTVYKKAVDKILTKKYPLFKGVEFQFIGR